MKNFIYIICFMLPMIGFTQIDQAQAAIAATNMNNLSSTNSLVTYDMTPTDIKGSRFFSETYYEGELWTQKETHYGDELLYRFDGIENSVQIKYKDSGKEVLLFKENVKRLDLKINAQVITFVRVPGIDPKDDQKLYQVIYLSKNVKLVKLFRKKLLTKTIESGGFDPDKNETAYEDKSLYFIKNGYRNNAFEPFNLSQKGLIKAFPDKETKIKQVLASGKYKKNLTDVAMGEVLKLLEDMTGKN